MTHVNDYKEDYVQKQIQNLMHFFFYRSEHGHLFNMKVITPYYM